MRLGWCAPLHDAPLLRRLGFDFIEAPLAPLGLEDQGTFAVAREAVRASPLPISAFNTLFPRDLRVVGPDVDFHRIDDYLARVVEILNAAKAEVVVFGSGWARNVPEGWERARAEAQLTAALSWCADALEDTRCTLVIEPLNRKESNIINSVAEGVGFAARVDRPEIRVLADFYHMDEEREPLGALSVNRDWLAHIHVADTGRRNPGTGTYDYDRFFGHLRAIGYAGMISAECTVEDREADMRHSLAFMRRRWAAAADRA